MEISYWIFRLMLTLNMFHVVVFIHLGRCVCYRLTDIKNVGIESDKTTVEHNYLQTNDIEASVSNNLSLDSTVNNETGVNLELGFAYESLSSKNDIAYLTAGSIDKEYVKPNSSDHLEEKDNNIDFERTSDTTAILIVGPAAAVGIFLFLCIAFYFHNMQLNNRYKRNKHLTITMYVSPSAEDDMDNNNVQLKPCVPQLARTRSVSPAPGRLVPVEGDLMSHRRKSLAPPQGLAPIGPGKGKRSTSVPPGIDKDLLTVSAAKRKQSVFIL